MADYSYEDTKAAYKAIGVGRDQVLFLETDLASLGVYDRMDREALPSAHLSALRDLVGEGGTVVVPTVSMSLCNTDIPFDLKTTPGEMGLFSEHVRLREGAVRSRHPFTSFAALGGAARDICGDVARHAYGPETPMARMLERDALFISLGFHPHYTCTTIHQVEMDMGVPYRYVREFMHPIRNEEVIRREPFYLYVWYYECDIQRVFTKKLWKQFESLHQVKKASLGRGKVYSYSMAEYYKWAIGAFKNDLYALLEEVPEKKPYRRSM